MFSTFGVKVALNACVPFRGVSLTSDVCAFSIGWFVMPLVMGFEGACVKVTC